MRHRETGVFFSERQIMNKKTQIETLCHKCVDDYEEAGFIVIKVPGQKFTDVCTHCQTGWGWDYEVKPKGG